MVVLDDYLAFVIASRFNIQPILLLDLLVLLVKDNDLDQTLAIQIIDSIAVRYSTPFIEHTKYKLKEVPR